MKHLLKRAMKRRDFVKYLGAGLAGPAFKNIFRYKQGAVEHLMGYVVPPEGVIPGLPNWYASVCRVCGAGCGIQVKVREGRAKKIEGHADFPVNYGKLCARGQAGLQALYNPDRIKDPQLKVGGKFKKISWDKALAMAATRLKKIKDAGDGDKVVLLSEPLRGSLGKLFSAVAAGLGTSQVFAYDFLSDDAFIEAGKLAFGESRFPNYDIANGSYVLSLGANFLDTWATPVKHSVAFGWMRDPAIGRHDRGWLVHFEPRLSVTGAAADEWFPINPGTEGLLALAIANVMVAEGLVHLPESLDLESRDIELREWKKALKNYAPSIVGKQAGVPAAQIKKIAHEFAERRPSVALCGGQATAQTHGTANALAAHVLNYLAGNIGKKGGVMFNAPSPLDKHIKESLSFKGISDLSDRMAALDVKALLLYNVNPVFNLPRPAGFEKNLSNVSFVVSFSPFMDETTAMADLILPDHTYLESWGDLVPLVDWGHQTVGLSQPVVAPLHNSRPVGDVLLTLVKLIGGGADAALPQASYLEFLKDSWKDIYDSVRGDGATEDTFEQFWEASVQRGGWWSPKEESAQPPKMPTPDIVPADLKDEPADVEGYEFNLWLYPSHAHYDGRTANLPWLQQFPEPLITAAWGTWAEVNPKTAKELDVGEGDLVGIESPQGKMTLPVYIYHGVEPKTVAVPIGQGHTKYGRYAGGRGVNPIRLVGGESDKKSGALSWSLTKIKLAKVNGKGKIVKTEPPLDLPGMEDGLREIDRHIVQWISPAEAAELKEGSLEPITALPTRDLRQGPHFLSGIGLGKYRESRYHDYQYRWGMVIDLDKCTGCSACMVACYAENNLPLVDEAQLEGYRHKNWIRVDRYWEGEFPEVRAKVMPVNCYQCGNAPCEPVCPVYAAFHTKDGLNGQVYQRCVGTRYCNVNCPYRSRLFNWLNPEWPEPLDQQLNPDISVRMAGVTEKCSFCVQRIRFAKDIAKDEGRRVRDGEVVPACAQTCPTGAISFGDLLDPKTRVSQLTRNPRRFRVFEKLLNTEPAVIYLKAVRAGAEHGAEGEAEAHDGGGAKSEVKHE